MMISKGKLLRLLRESQNLLQEDVAEQAGISASYLSLIENGHKQPSNGVLNQLAQIYRIPSILLYWNEEDLNQTATDTERSFLAKINEVVEQLFILIMKR